MKLSKRLTCIANIIEKYCDTTDILADIGTDHGYLPCYLVENTIINKAYACDVAKGPLSSTIETVSNMGLDNKVIPMLGNGLEPVLNTPTTIVSISGMGGFLMEEILKSNLDQLPNVHTLVLQANICEHVIREYLSKNNWFIINEDIIYDANHIYEVIVFKRGSADYSDVQLKFGPVLLQNKPTIFIEKWEKEINIKTKVLNSINDKKHHKYLEALSEIELIKGVLYEK